jgi:hypothetical protein
MSDYPDMLEKEVMAAARVLLDERYYEHVDCLYEMIRLCKHYQRITESLLNQVHGARTFEECEAETDRARRENDWYRSKGDE